ncbi:cGMP-dependent protein kinase 2 isoform 2-T2 [Ammospiza maritima maritima]
MNFAIGEEDAGKLPRGTGASCCIPEQLTCRGVAGTSFLITCFTEHYNISDLRLFSSEMSLDKMGNGLVKPKHLRQPNRHVANLAIGCAASHKFLMDPCLGINVINGPADVLCSKILELEKELKRKDQQLQESRSHVAELQEQLAMQTKVIAELTKELQSKCIQLNKLQDVVSTQGEHSLQPSPFKVSADRRRGAKEGVSAEPTTGLCDLSRQTVFSLEKATVRKDSSEKKLITDALNKNQFLKRLEPHQTRDMVECMYERTFQQGSYVIRQGEPGNHIFVLKEGSLEVFQQNKLLSSIPVWTAFGELAILYNCTRTASVKAITNVKTWALDREVFQNIMRVTAQTRQEQYRNFLRSVALLKNLPEDKLTKIMDCLEVEYYDKGDYVIREGEEGNTFFIIAKGKVIVTQSTTDHSQPQVIKNLYKGDYFGEKALISDDVRSANVIADEYNVECLVIDRETFNQTVGTYEELQTYLEGYVANLAQADEKRHAKGRSFCGQLTKEVSLEMIELKEKVAQFPPSPFQNLEVVTTLGVGGFGRVELVKVKNENVAFAMKCIKKKHVVDTKQQEHIYSEKKILEQICSPFVVKLYRTFKDNKYVYMLLEACLGGELWSLLRDRGSFDEFTTKFCVGCVTEAFDYLHQIGIIYRDLKPENLILDAEGYIKLVDFGFAKKIGSGQKTWTFCGTPEYVAPEVILSKGHDFSVDFWSLGILVYELLTGSPPFSGADQMMTYNLILKGIEKLDFPKAITRRPEDLIRRLCRQNPTERLGNLRNGINDIKKHSCLDQLITATLTAIHLKWGALQMNFQAGTRISDNFSSWHIYRDP